MMVSTKGRYALQIMLELAARPEEYLSLGDIAARQEISLKYLEAIAAKLTKAGLIESKRGKLGGYRLTPAPEACTVGEVLKLTESSLASVSCLEKGACTCGRSAKCLTRPMWLELDKRIDAYLESVTLADLLSPEWRRAHFPEEG